ncbi:hypothetical protein IMG5_104290 [Ichthyophthirius multifiliis]|uniref:NADH:flavin oxidoreductase/NADH oxidase N-terminal domain-containing protein n=1 Tax=Ichthyophthirius multifiliis TaxID=5932 RepID=G0QSX2_ICHMU|nr:hypothetical protein IMG5_104290 [Ichthyophthirius multifiliis]EGR31688.1 hypothetical protein IMG5_104290 [Ichthyophthirius multifiliis]|eukprot:XP_004035174.1 hypothetical protein IMG5_104290 [Ichthyophthirius multifiliis]
MGDLQIKNRICMAALTRERADPKTLIPTDLMAEYYSQRTQFGMILTDCATVSKIGHCFERGPGIFTQEQADGWKKIVDKVHQGDSLIFMQIWHGGRASDPLINKSGITYGPSPIGIKLINRRANNEYYKVPHEMTKQQIKEVIEEFKQGAIYCKQAGFDGIQLHGANGYLVDQFLRDSSNQRNDEYGGSVENKCRFCLEIIDALIEVYGNSKRIGIKISPVSRFNDMYDNDPIKTFSYLIQELDKRNIGFIELREVEKVMVKSNYPNDGKEQIPDCAKQFRHLFKGIIIDNEGFEYQSGLDKLKEGNCDMISFGRLAISNPDLPFRFQKGLQVNNNYDQKTYYSEGEIGYIDYPFFE